MEAMANGKTVSNKKAGRNSSRIGKAVAKLAKKVVNESKREL